MASGFIAVDTPGLAAANLSRFTVHHRRVPMFPFERDTSWA
jgi:microcystin degradation protein MlrC